MSPWKRLLLTAYYHATRPVRAWTYRREAAHRRLPIIVLCYHRVADDRANDWTVSNAAFCRQVQWMQERFDLVSLADAQDRIGRDHNSRPCVSITFDDGYADNCQQAVPWLIKQQIPCTYFVAARNVLHAEPFAYDLAMGNRLAPNTVEQLRAMAAAGVEIGSHTCTHADLGSISDPRRLHYEIAQSREDLQAAIDRPIRYFAFPYGLRANLSAQAFAIVKAVGYAGACSAYGGRNYPGDDPFHLQRIPIGEELIQLQNWLTGDPRKPRVKRFEYLTGDSGQWSAVSGQWSENQNSIVYFSSRLPTTDH